MVVGAVAASERHYVSWPTMPLPKVMAVVNAIVAATILIWAANVVDTSGQIPVSAAFIKQAATQTAPEFGLDILARGVEDWQHRAAVLKWLCFVSVALLFVNMLCWAARHREAPAS